MESGKKNGSWQCLDVKVFAATVIALMLPCKPVGAQEDLNVVSNNWLEFSDARNSLYHYLSERAYELLEERASRIAGIRTLDQWQERQNFIRTKLNELIGPFPAKTDLNARVTRVIGKTGYRIEHIIYESQPGFYVTSSLFIPAGVSKGKKAPAIIYCSGHTVEGYRSPVYIHVIQNLVKKGFIVFAFDPVGQGERLEYYDPSTGKSMVGGPTKEHSYPGAQAFLTGSSQAFHMIWDGIRAVDYLLTRKEVDPSRIGITGRSGGGTQSAYISAVDDRIYAAAPENYITNYSRLFQSIGPQDAEQNIPRLIISGLDHPDFLIIRAPKPTLLITTTRDIFSIQGARETRNEVSAIFESYGAGENFNMVEDDAQHESTVKNREAMYAFFQKFLNNPGSPADFETEVLTEEELRVTAAGQVSESFAGETVYSLNLKRLSRLTAELNIRRKDPGSFYPEVIRSAERLSGYIKPEKPLDPVFTGRIKKDDYSIEKYFIELKEGYIIPYLIFKPSVPGNRVMLFLDPEGKNHAFGNDGSLEMIVKEGITILAPDLLGVGEMGSGDFKGDADFNGASHNLWYASILTGRSILGIHAGDIARLVRLILKDNPEAEIIGFARGAMSPALLHAAAFNNEIRSIILEGPYSSFRSIANCRFYLPLFILSTVSEALKEYDLPDLAASLAPRRLILIDPVDGNGKREHPGEVNRDIDLIKAGFQYYKADSQLTVISSADNPSTLPDLLRAMDF